MKAIQAGGAARHEHEYEPQRGLPEVLPRDEKLLWQGSPDWRMLARHAFHLRKLALYFAALVLLRVGFVFDDTGSVAAALRSSLGPLAMALVALALVASIAWLSARSTVYTLTDKRVVMRIGIVLTLSFNIPHRRIAAAGLHLDARGTGDLPLTLLPPDHIAYLHLWPHARPWHLARPAPMLRSVPDAAEVARLLTQAWCEATGRAAEPQADAGRTRPASPTHAANGQPALAGH